MTMSHLTVVLFNFQKSKWFLQVDYKWSLLQACTVFSNERQPNPELPSSYRCSGTKMATSAFCGRCRSHSSLLWGRERSSPSPGKPQLLNWGYSSLCFASGAAPCGAVQSEAGHQIQSPTPSSSTPSPPLSRSTYRLPALLEHWQPFLSVLRLAAD